MEEDIRNDLITVGTTPVLVCEERNRLEINLSNVSAAAQQITLSFGQEAVFGYGVVLLPYAVYWATVTMGFKPTRGKIWAVASAAGAQLSIMERPVV